MARISKSQLDAEVRKALVRGGQPPDCIIDLWSKDAERRATARDYAWVDLGTPIPRFGFSKKTLSLDEAHRNAVVAHEVGHVLAWRHYGDDSEPGADAAATQILGVPICYDRGYPGKGLQIDCRVATTNPRGTMSTAKKRKKNPSSRKFDSDLAETYYGYALDGDDGDEHVSNEYVGEWANLYREYERVGGARRLKRGVILYGDSQGFVYATSYDSEPELEQAWKLLEGDFPQGEEENPRARRKTTERPSNKPNVGKDEYPEMPRDLSNSEQRFYRRMRSELDMKAPDAWEAILGHRFMNERDWQYTWTDRYDEDTGEKVNLVILQDENGDHLDSMSEFTFSDIGQYATAGSLAYYMVKEGMLPNPRRSSAARKVRNPELSRAPCWLNPLARKLRNWRA